MHASDLANENLPLPASALSALSYINSKDSLIDELEGLLGRARNLVGHAADVPGEELKAQQLMIDIDQYFAEANGDC